jgi:radical SAM superfamily enzyme YgiQ (UPF0313 family)
MKRSLLFLQLPRLDHDARGRQENIPLAAVYLRYALEKSAERDFHRVVHIPNADSPDDRYLLKEIRRLKPDVIAATLYLWNIERTLSILEQARMSLPRLNVIAGGPEVAAGHPFLFRNSVVDVAVSGEGENVFSAILKALRTGRHFVQDTKSPPCDLRTSLPPPLYPHHQPDAYGMAYLETTRGCPLRCSYCCYGHRRREISFLDAEDVTTRVRILRERGAREIRFIDPTFNANPAFRRIVAGLAALNRNHKLKFFAELQADRITSDDARRLAAANFREIEVGVQSRNSETLRRIHRPTHLRRLDHGINRLTRAGILVTIDLMYGLPGQDLREIRQMLNWAAGLRGVRIQCLQTLLLPGTELRRDRKRYELNALDQPPYQVQSTASFSATELRRAETMVRQKLGITVDCPTKRFIGRDLPDLFDEQFTIPVGSAVPGGFLGGVASAKDSSGHYTGGRNDPRCVPVLTDPILGSRNRRTFIYQGRNLFARRRELAAQIRKAVAFEPHILWQFVLEPETEEPLDLLDLLIMELNKFPPLVSDRFLDMHSPGRRASRRVMIRLRPGRKYDASWQEAAEELLRKEFF